jgi:hypothetical protein
MAVFTVTSAADTGPGTLREAITLANAAAGADEVRFNIPGDGVRRISVSTPLPQVSSPLTIDGYTQPGASPNTLPVGNNATLLVELVGPELSFGNGLDFRATSTVRGLAIGRFSTNVQVGAADCVIEGCFIGTDASGTQVYAVPPPSGTFQTLPTRNGIYNPAGSRIRVGGDAPGQRNVISGAECGLSLGADDPLIANNYLGLDASGQMPVYSGQFMVRGDLLRGLRLGSGSSGGGNVIVGTCDISTRGQSTVAGNLVGLSADGTTALAPFVSYRHGFRVSGDSGLFVGGPDPRHRNVFANEYVQVVASGGARVQGNFFGTDKTGLAAAGTNFLGLYAYTNTSSINGFVVGGLNPGEGNVFGGSAEYGATIENAVTFQGNYVGVGADGATAVPNAVGGVAVRGAGGVVGGTTAAAANVIGRNNGPGVTLAGVLSQYDPVAEFPSSDAKVWGNFIGTTPDGLTALPNAGPGVLVEDTSNAAIGGPTRDYRNIIINNAGGGVIVRQGRFGARGIVVQSAFLRDNAGIGIDLGEDGSTPNDPLDADDGPNGLQNSPVITAVRQTANGLVRVRGRIDTKPNTAVTVDLYRNQRGAADAEGETLFGTITLTTDASGSATFERYVTPIVALASISATATTADGTSELSAARTAALVGDLNGDGAVNNLDIAPFVAALTNPAAYAAQYPGVDWLVAGDVNDDGAFNNLDIAPFVQLLTGSPVAAPPLTGVRTPLPGGGRVARAVLDGPGETVTVGLSADVPPARLRSG